MSTRKGDAMDDALRAWLNWPNLPPATRLTLSRNALAERFAAVNRVMPNGLDTPAQLFRACEAIAPHFVPPGCYHGATAIPTFAVDDCIDRQTTCRPSRQLDAHLVRRVAYGRLGKGDSIGIHLHDELFKMINRLAWTKATPAWRARQ